MGGTYILLKFAFWGLSKNILNKENVLFIYF